MDSYPATENQAWGFWGASGELAQTLWPLALNTIAEATQESPHSVRRFLDSTKGRHFADEVRNQLSAGNTPEGAIRATVQQWMSWKISKQISRRYGIPMGLPYLTGFILDLEITETVSD